MISSSADSESALQCRIFLLQRETSISFGGPQLREEGFHDRFEVE
jgi:hypothetical protein